jgi:hypothetical protein
VLRRIFGPKRDEVTGSGEDFITSSFLICTPHPAGDKIEKNEMDGACSADGRGGVYRVFVGKPEEETTGETQA